MLSSSTIFNLLSNVDLHVVEERQEVVSGSVFSTALVVRWTVEGLREEWIYMCRLREEWIYMCLLSLSSRTCHDGRRYEMSS